MGTSQRDATNALKHFWEYSEYRLSEKRNTEINQISSMIVDL